ncbi:cytochrome P450 [Cladochytrium replicatum]|nr:cytochrome P450 [Cladochytrium replicatum]
MVGLLSTLAVILVAVTAATLIRTIFLKKKRPVPTSIPRPPGWIPVLGHSRLFAGDPNMTSTKFDSWAWKLGPVYAADLAGRELVLVSDPDLIHQLMKRRHTDLAPGTALRNSLESLNMGHNVSVTEDYEEWRGLRRILEQPLTPANIKKMVPYIIRTAHQLYPEFERIAKSQAEFREQNPKPTGFSESQFVTLLPILKKATFDTMMLFGFDLDENEYSQQLKLADVERVSQGMLKRVRSVIPYWKYFLTTEDREIVQASERVRKTSYKIVQAAIERVQKAEGAQVIREHSLLDHYVKSQMPEEQRIAKLSYDALVDNVFAILFAAYDTSATTTDTILHVLAKHPNVQQKVFEEASSVLKFYSTMSPYQVALTLGAAFDMKTTFPYTHAVVREVNRLYPLTTMFPVDAKNDIQLNNHLIPAGTPIIMLLHAAQLKGSAYDDAFEFRPERWFEIEADKQVSDVETRNVFAFGGGSRICPGRHAGMAQLVIFTAFLVARFRFSFLAAPPYVTKLSASFTSHPLKIEKRD